MQKKISVGIADMKLTRQEGVLITYALGSCIGITFYDPMIKLGAAPYHAPGKNKFAGFQYFEICGHRYTGNTSKVLYIRRSERTDSL